VRWVCGLLTSWQLRDDHWLCGLLTSWQLRDTGQKANYWLVLKEKIRAAPCFLLREL
jgi:hypothetical protein